MAAYRVLIMPEMLRYIADFHTSSINPFITTSRISGIVHRGKVLYCDTDTYALAGRSGDINLLKVIYRHVKEFPWRLTGLAVIQCGYIDIVKWMIMEWKATSTKFHSDSMVTAAYHGHLEIVKLLHESGVIKCYDETIDYAASGGHLQVVKWLHENLPNTDWLACEEAIDNAAHHGHLDVVQWLHRNRTEGFTRHALIWAAENGHLDILKFLHQSCTDKCTIHIMNCAAATGKLEVLKWLNTNCTKGCGYFAPIRAIRNKHIDVIHWLMINRTEVSVKGTLRLILTEPYAETAGLFFTKYPQLLSEDLIWLSIKNNQGPTVKRLLNICSLDYVNNIVQKIMHGRNYSDFKLLIGLYPAGAESTRETYILSLIANYRKNNQWAE